MRLVQHVKYTTIASTALLFLWNLPQIAWFAVGSIFIDVDHYIAYVLRFKRFDVKGMFQYFNEWLPENKEKISYGGICIFHTIEIYLMIWIASAYFPFLYFILTGMIFHIVLDYVYLFRNKAIFTRAFSIIEHFIRVGKHGKNGYPYVNDVLE
jgi:hypothetical protein